MPSGSLLCVAEGADSPTVDEPLAVLLPRGEERGRAVAHGGYDLAIVIEPRRELTESLVLREVPHRSHTAGEEDRVVRVDLHVVGAKRLLELLRELRVIEERGVVSVLSIDAARIHRGLAALGAHEVDREPGRLEARHGMADLGQVITGLLPGISEAIVAGEDEQNTVR